MVKGRIILSLVVIGFLLGVKVLLGMNFPIWLEIGLGAFGGVLALAAASLLLLTFFVIDSEGRIPRSSLLYRFLTLGYKVTIGKPVGNQVNLCSIFWLLAIGYLLGLVVISVVGGIIVFVIYQSMHGNASEGARDGGLFALGMVGLVVVILVVLGAGTLIWAFIENHLQNAIARFLYAVLPWVLGLSVLGLAVVGGVFLLFGVPIINLMEYPHNMTFIEAWETWRYWFGIGLGITIGVIIALAGLVRVSVVLFPTVRSIVMPIYDFFHGRLCVIFPVEQT